MRRSNCRPVRSCRQNQVNTSLNTTIDLTDDDGLLSYGTPSSLTSSSESNTSRSSSNAWELIDLSAEPDTAHSEVGRPSVHDPPAIQAAREADEVFGGVEDDSDDDLPIPPNIPVFDLPKTQPICPICFTELIKAEGVVTTKCGHVFCKNCIMNSLKVKSKCPLCRKKVLNSQLIVIYLQSP